MSLTASSESPACLGVHESLSGWHWIMRDHPPHVAMGLSERFHLPAVLGEILAARHISLEQAQDYLYPTLRALLPDPSGLQDMDKAAMRLADAIMGGETIGVFGDYDVDGTAASAMLLDYLTALSCAGEFYIPDRLREGYGPNVAALHKLAARNVSLLITVDCGTMAHEALGAAKQLGMDVIVTDHHQSATDLPPALAIVNPRRLDDTSGMGHLAGVGVAFLLLVATNRVLRQRNFFVKQAEPNLLDMLDLVALGTVCDLVPLQGINRAFVAQGIKCMQQRPRPGIKALCEVARLETVRSATDLGFGLGPRLNAGGRVSQASLGMKLLHSKHAGVCRQLAYELETLNNERKMIQDKLLATACAQLNFNMPPPVIVCGDVGWHVGLIGIVAARLKDIYQRPSFVMSFDDEGLGKGSARSVFGIDLGQLISRGVAAGCLLSGGGHAMAAGFTLKKSQVPALRAFLEQELKTLPLDALYTKINERMVDGLISAHACTRDFCDQLTQLGPYGAGHLEPRFAIPKAKILWAQERGAGHIAARLGDDQGSIPLSAMAFARVHEQVRARLLLASKQRQRLHILGQLRADDYRNRQSVCFHIEDASHAVG